MEGPYQSGYEVWVRPHREDSLARHVRDLTDNISGTFPQANADAFFTCKQLVVLVGTTMQDLAIESVQAGYFGLVDCLVCSRANSNGIKKPSVRSLSIWSLHHNIPTSR